MKPLDKHGNAITCFKCNLVASLHMTASLDKLFYACLYVRVHKVLAPVNVHSIFRSIIQGQLQG